MNKLLERYLADFNRPTYTWQAPREEPGGWSTLMVLVAVLALVVFLVGRYR